MHNKKVVFIMGTGHCGSTLLELILSSHSRIFGLGELNELDLVIDQPFQDFPKLCGLCEGECEFWNRKVPFGLLQRYFSHKRIYSPLVTRANHYYRSIYRHFFDQIDQTILTDSSKSIGWIRRQLRPSGHWNDIIPILLYITRDGRAVVNSYLRKYPERGMEQVTADWKRNVERMNSLYTGYPSDNRLILSYEKLATLTPEVVDSICRFLQVRYEPKMLSYWTEDHHIVGGNLGTRSLILRYRAQFSKGQNSNQAFGIRRSHDDHYSKLGLAIRPDLRWKRELTEEQLQVFETIAGDINIPFAY